MCSQSKFFNCHNAIYQANQQLSLSRSIALVLRTIRTAKIRSHSYCTDTHCALSGKNNRNFAASNGENFQASKFAGNANSYNEQNFATGNTGNTAVNCAENSQATEFTGNTSSAHNCLDQNCVPYTAKTENCVIGDNRKKYQTVTAQTSKFICNSLVS